VLAPRNVFRVDREAQCACCVLRWGSVTCSGRAKKGVLVAREYAVRSVLSDGVAKAAKHFADDGLTWLTVHPAQPARRMVHPTCILLESNHASRATVWSLRPTDSQETVYCSLPVLLTWRSGVSPRFIVEGNDPFSACICTLIDSPQLCWLRP
jgi:hypothetical protein